MNVGLIVACDPNGVIGIDNGIPWKYPSDLQRFKALTMGGTLIMGRKTFESIGRRHLPGRSTFVVSRTMQPDVLTFPSIELTLAWAEQLGAPVWIIGGAQIYQQALEKRLVDFVDLTLVPPVTIPEGDHQIATFPMHLLTGVTPTVTLAPPLEHRRYELR